MGHYSLYQTLYFCAYFTCEGNTMMIGKLFNIILPLLALTLVPIWGCMIEGEFPQRLKMFEKARTETAEECQKMCADDARCDYFKWKKKAGSRRVCMLIEVVWLT